MKELCPQVNLPTAGGTSLELMTSYNEVLIPCLGPLAASSLGPNGYSKQLRSVDLNISFDPALSLSPTPPSFPACEPCASLPWIRDTESLSEDPWDHVRRERRLAPVLAAWQTSFLCATATGDETPAPRQLYS